MNKPNHSPEKESASLNGWGTALYPSGIDLLQAVYDAYDPDLDTPWLNTAAGQVDDFPLTGIEEGPKTDDGDEWLVAYYYLLPRGGKAVIFLPKRDGAGNCIRHCAVFARLDLDKEKDLSALVSNLAGAIDD